jgi:SAM-dependent methyltransferase
MDREFEEHYAAAAESRRLQSARGRLEFERTLEIVARTLPPPPAVIADIGGGPGRYTLWLADQGYEVEHRDVWPPHVREVAETGHANVRTRAADARKLDISSGSVDGVLLLGPLYHLHEMEERLASLREARRIVRDNGRVYVAAISRWAQRLDGLLTGRIYEKYPDALARVRQFEATGSLMPFRTGGFYGYSHRPTELSQEIEESGLLMDALVGVEGLPLSEDELKQRWPVPSAREVLLESARAIEAVPELLGLSSHLLATARRPPE